MFAGLVKSNFVSPLRRATTNLRCLKGIQTNNQIRSYAFNARDEGPNVRHFVAVGIIGTIVFVGVVHKINDQDPSSSLAKKKNTFTEAEWEAQIKRKKLAFAPGEADFYLVPFVPKDQESKVSELKNKVSDNHPERVVSIDLNTLIETQMKSPSATFGTVLKDTLDKQDFDNNTCHYQFNYKLAIGIFTRLIKDEALRIQRQSPEINTFLLLNYPNNVAEAIKFDQDVATSKALVLLGGKDESGDIVDYFSTVDKVTKFSDL